MRSPLARTFTCLCLPALAAALTFAACDSSVGGGGGGSGGSAGKDGGMGGGGGGGSGGSGGGGSGGSDGGGMGGGSGGTDPAIKAIQAQIDAAKVDKSKSDWRQHLTKPTAVTFTSGKTYVWHLATSKGDMTLAFKPTVAPLHVTSTIYLTMMGFYDGLTFHRVIPAFMAQGGDPLGTGTGGPGYGYDLENPTSEKYDGPGRLGMANTGMPGSEGSQFFITFKAVSLDAAMYTIFGQLTAGMTALSAIEAVGSAGGMTSEKVTITSATVTVE